jgi:hypothetical protein
MYIYTLSITQVASTVWDLNLLSSWQENSLHAVAYDKKVILMPKHLTKFTIFNAIASFDFKSDEVWEKVLVMENLIV